MSLISYRLVENVPFASVPNTQTHTSELCFMLSIILVDNDSSKGSVLLLLRPARQHMCLSIW